MARSNPHFLDLKREYIFPVIEKKLEALCQSKPALPVINVGIGDVYFPLSKTVASAIAHACMEMTEKEHVRGYGPSDGYPFLKEAIHASEYAHTNIQPEEIFISDGINSDIASCPELFHPKSAVAIPDPTYPVYLDSCLLAGRKITLMPCKEQSRCLPTPPENSVDIVYLCSPSNPTGEALTKKELASFIRYAKEHSAIILYDSAYSAFITSDDVPKTIYEVEGASDVAVEFKSFSKSAGFTGLRCGYTVVPKALTLRLKTKRTSLWQLWNKRISMKSNGVSYPIQKGALSCFSTEGKKETQEQVAAYLNSARIFCEGLQSLGYTCYGGKDAPYIWWKVPSPYSSWQFFDKLLEECQIVAIPGRGFGAHGEGFIRISGFTEEHIAREALKRIKTLKY